MEIWSPTFPSLNVVIVDFNMEEARIAGASDRDASLIGVVELLQNNTRI
jgi:hypothetical protein